MKNKPTMRRIINSIQIVLLVVAAVMMLTGDYAYFEQYPKRIVPGYPYPVLSGTPSNEGVIAFSNLYNGNPFFATLTLGLIGMCILICIASIIRRSNDRDGFLHVLLPLFVLGAFYVFAYLMANAADVLTENGTVNKFHYYDMPKIVMGISFAVFLLALVKRSKLLTPRETVNAVIVNDKNVPASNADELKKYKELLDSGAITQEEYEAKKKQLLDL